MIGLIGGFVGASITAFNVRTVNQGNGSINTAGTAYGCAATCLTATQTTGSTTAAACANAPAATALTGANPTVTLNVMIASAGTTCKGGDFAEVFSFTSTFALTAVPACFTTTTSCSDSFLVSTVVAGVSSNAQLGTAAFTESATLPTGTVTVNLNVTVDYQQAANPGISSISIDANGNY
jgi:hypothetical protein